MEKQLSIIVPTYNMERYIGRCLESLIIPSFDNVEVIVVNDGSKDRSFEIAQEYAMRFPNSIYVLNKENGNYGSCIDAALKIASGRYVKVLDSDDFFDNQSFENFVESLANIDTDVVLTSYTRIEEDTLKSFAGKDLVQIGMPIGKSLSLDQVRHYLFYPLMHMVTYKLQLLRKLQYVQTEGISYTDTEWCFMPFAKAESFLVLPISLYKYLIGREGQTVSPHVMAKSNKAFFMIIKKLICTYESHKHNLTSEQQRYLNDYLANVYITLALRILHSGEADQCREFKLFDLSLKEQHLVWYEKFDKLSYNRRSNYKIINRWRRSDYCEKFKLPYIALIQLNLIAFLSNIRKLIFKRSFFNIFGR